MHSTFCRCWSFQRQAELRSAAAVAGHPERSGGDLLRLHRRSAFRFRRHSRHHGGRERCPDGFCASQGGPEHLKTVLKQFSNWLEEHEYESVRQMRGAMNLRHCPDVTGFERANYLRILHGWQVIDFQRQRRGQNGERGEIR